MCQKFGEEPQEMGVDVRIDVWVRVDDNWNVCFNSRFTQQNDRNLIPKRSQIQVRDFSTSSCKQFWTAYIDFAIFHLYLLYN